MRLTLDLHLHSQASPDGRMTVEEIAALAGQWDAFRRESDPGLDLNREELENVKKNSVTTRGTGCGGGC